MENETVTPETTNEPVEETVETPLEQHEVIEGAEMPQGTPESVAQLQATNKKLYERAKKAEADLKAAKASKPVEAKVAPSQPGIEETVLLANGMSDELLGELKAVAKARGIPSLIKAQNDPIFVAVKANFEKDQKQKASSMPASRGAGQVKPKKDFATPNLSREEHMAMVKSI